MFHNCRSPGQPVFVRNDSNSTQTYDCDLCDSGDWLSETEVELHKKSMHMKELTTIVTQTDTRNTCLTCTKTFPDHTSVVTHIKTDHLFSSISARRIEREIFICEHCKQIFFNKQLLAFHIIYRHFKTHNRVKLKCVLCHRSKSSKAIYGHLTRHQLQSASSCQICLRKQPNTKALVRHLDTHPKYYHCNICGYISNKDKDFNMHLDKYERRKSRFEVKRYKDYFLHPHTMASWKYNPLRLGLRGLVLFNFVYICVLCRQICTSHDEMQEHILRDHTIDVSEIPTTTMRVCSCGKEFLNMTMFKHHTFKSTGEHNLEGTVKRAGNFFLNNESPVEESRRITLQEVVTDNTTTRDEMAILADSSDESMEESRIAENNKELQDQETLGTEHLAYHMTWDKNLDIVPVLDNKSVSDSDVQSDSDYVVLEVPIELPVEISASENVSANAVDETKTV